MIRSSNSKKAFRLAAGACVLASALMFVTGRPASAIDECIATTTNGHGNDSAPTGDCVDMNVYTATDGRIIVRYWGNQDFDFYQLRWSRPGLAEKQLKPRGSGSQGGWWALNNAHPDTPYTFKVQACYSSVFGSDCTGWKETTYTLPAATRTDPATCATGYVWRNAFPGDLVCVTPQARALAAYDNSQAALRRDPNGAWGPYSCISGYVWRVARPEDLVCVTPERRAQTAYDNSQAAARLANR
jgi:hypothetical protein